MQRADVSVLTPVLNEERYIRDAVAGMRAQRFDGRIELIFIDGRSMDRTVDILRELAADDDRICVLDNPAAKYAGSAQHRPASRHRRLRRTDGRPHPLSPGLPLRSACGASLRAAQSM